MPDTYAQDVREHQTLPLKLVTSVNFRELVLEIRDTGYLTHGLFYYPARFIPQVPRFCLRNYTKEGDWVVDPFAGSGTVGLEAVLMNRNAILIDINPLLNHIVPAKILFQHAYLELHILQEMLDDMMQSSEMSRIYLYCLLLLKVLYINKIILNIKEANTAI